ncbi:MAG: CHASE domain-containing protein [Steroidobacteraceae bacterium]|nr:CHASE domain-containing protein [Steroidobacteraceae bacterium]
MKANYATRVLLLAALYVITGRAGLLLAVPPGYATIIWPASGIAIAMLLVHGPRLWPGVFVGSLLLNAWHSGVFADETWFSTKLWIAAFIAAGSTLQALVGRALVARFIGLPLRLETGRQIVALLALAGPVTCVIAATIGSATLFSLGALERADTAGNWLAWWTGDTLGVLLFMPLVLLAPGSREHLRWRGANVGRLPLGALLLLLLPLGLTFYAWKATTENNFQRGDAKFETLTIESEKALQNRLASYGSALLGAAGFVQGSAQVSSAEWRTYVETIKVRENFPGMNGIGWIEPVENEDISEFLADARVGAPGFRIHPDVRDIPRYVVRYIEPESTNHLALGLNIAFERERRTTAEFARDSGHAAITRPVVLVQDEQQTAGFLMLYPVYRQGAPTGSPNERRDALRGWACAPLIARNFLTDLTHSQRTAYRVRVYDGATADAKALIFESEARTGPRPRFVKRASLRIQQRHWLAVWESTEKFERSEDSANPLFILIGGLVFTALLALLLIVATVRRAEDIEPMVGRRRFLVPLLVFTVVAAGNVVLYSKLLVRERDGILEEVADQMGEVDARLRMRVSEGVDSLMRMGARWDTDNGTPEARWRRDAANYVAQLAGLRTIEWIDSTYHVRWIESAAGHESAVGLDVGFDTKQMARLRDAAERRAATLSPPRDFAQGFPAFTAYAPVTRHGRFDGFIAASFATNDFFESAMGTEQSRDFTASILHGGREYFTNALADEIARGPHVQQREMRLHDQTWTLRLAPTAAFITRQQSVLPPLVLFTGLLVAALAALAVRYILIARLKSAHLAKSLALNAGIISSSAHLVIAIDPDYRIMTFNRAAENALGYPAAEVVGKRAIPMFMDMGELEERARSLSLEVGEAISVGPQIFTRIPLLRGQETREWTFVRKNGSRFPVSVIITPLRDAEGTVTGYLGVIEDVTARKEVERMKSEFTAVVSHELRTPLTSIRGSLGLILGALSSSLPAKVKDLLGIAQNNCERLVLLVNDILDLEKFSAGQMRFVTQVVPLAPLVRQAVGANEGYAANFDVWIDFDTADDCVQVEVDPDRFIQVMSNLLSNASKYSPPGGTVRVRAECLGEQVRVSVRDDGPGVPKEFRARIFEKFAQADSSATREKGGTGLGLHISQRFIERMSGKIGFDSEPGAGSTFWVELPVVR